jgi:hypothetical protein
VLKLILYVLVYGSIFLAISKKYGSIANKTVLIVATIIVTLVSLVLDMAINQYLSGYPSKPTFPALVVGFIFYNVMKPDSATQIAPIQSDQNVAEVAEGELGVMRSFDITRDGAQFVVYGADGATAFNYSTLDEAVAAAKRLHGK